jgi:hypothetical protein
VFIFGAEKLGTFTDEVKLEFDTYMVATTSEYKKHQQVANNRVTGVVVLAKKFAVGADLKYPIDAQVINFNTKNVTREELFQKFGRGSRSLGQIKGLHVTVVKPG